MKNNYDNDDIRDNDNKGNNDKDNNCKNNEDASKNDGGWVYTHIGCDDSLMNPLWRHHFSASSHSQAFEYDSVLPKATFLLQQGPKLQI